MEWANTSFICVALALAVGFVLFCVNALQPKQNPFVATPQTVDCKLIPEISTLKLGLGFLLGPNYVHGPCVWNNHAVPDEIGDAKTV